MKSRHRPVSSVSLLADQLQKSCLHDRSNFIGLTKSGYCCSSPSHNNVFLTKASLPPNSNLCFQYDTGTPRTVHFQQVFTPRSCEESPGYSDQDEHAHSPTWHHRRRDQQGQEDQPLQPHLHPQQEEEEERCKEVDDSLEADHLRQYSTSAPVFGFTCGPRLPSSYSPTTAAGWTQSPVSCCQPAELPTAQADCGHHHNTQHYNQQHHHPYYPLSKRACRSSTCSSSSNSHARRADGHLRPPAAAGNSHTASSGCLLMASHIQGLPRPIAIRHSREFSLQQLRSTTASSRRDANASRLSWPKSTTGLAPLSSSFPPSSQMKAGGGIRLVPIPTVVAGQPVDQQCAPPPSTPLSTPAEKLGASFSAADNRHGNSRPSAFTPTRSIATSKQQPHIDSLQLSNCSSSFSPDTTDSVSSPLQLQQHQPPLLTPSSGFHETSFSYLSTDWSSSLPDCSNCNVFKMMMANCRHSEAGYPSGCCCCYSTNQTVTLDPGCAMNPTLNGAAGVGALEVDVMNVTKARIDRQQPGDDCVFSPHLCLCGQLLRDYEVPADCCQQEEEAATTLSRPATGDYCPVCSTDRCPAKTSHGQQLTVGGAQHGLKRRRGAGSTSTVWRYDRSDGEIVGGQEEAKTRGVLDATFPLHQSPYWQTVSTSSTASGDHLTLDPRCALTGSCDPATAAADQLSRCSSYCYHPSPAVGWFSELGHCQSPASTVGLTSSLLAAGGGSSNPDTASDEVARQRDNASACLACRHRYSQLDKLREEESEEDEEEVSGRSSSQPQQQHEQETPDTLTGEERLACDFCIAGGWDWDCHPRPHLRQHHCQCVCSRQMPGVSASLSPGIGRLAFTPIHSPSPEGDSALEEGAIAVDTRCGSAASEAMSSPQLLARGSPPTACIIDIDLNLIEND